MSVLVLTLFIAAMYEDHATADLRLTGLDSKKKKKEKEGKHVVPPSWQPLLKSLLLESLGVIF